MQLCIASTKQSASLHGVMLETRNAIAVQLHRYITLESDRSHGILNAKAPSPTSSRRFHLIYAE